GQRPRGALTGRAAPQNEHRSFSKYDSVWTLSTAGSLANPIDDPTRRTPREGRSPEPIPTRNRPHRSGIVLPSSTRSPNQTSSPPPVAPRTFPSGEKAPEPSQSVRPSRRESGRPIETLQSWTAPSPSAVASMVPSGENATELIATERPTMIRSNRPDLRS